jgi:PTS system nitrogen regulatory IIA component
MNTKVDLTKLIHKGGVFEIEASDAKDAFRKIADTIELPSDIKPDLIYKSLCEREAVLTTAVGNGIALPHARAPIFAEENEQRICIVYLKHPIDMKAPDGVDVNVMFVLLSHNNQTHLAILSALAVLFNNAKFKKALEIRASEEKLAAIIRDLA